MPRTVAEGTVEAIRDAMEQLRRCTAAVGVMLEGDYDDKLASHLSWLTKNMSQCLDAIRKQEAAERARWKSMGVEEETALIKVWCDEASVQARNEIAEHIASMGEAGSVLS